ncbi:MAG: hypothetical protein ACI9D0_000596 [Bacteroidia bacterium]|jgi:hypothetical protein
MQFLIPLLVGLIPSLTTPTQEPSMAQFGSGDGASMVEGTLRLLDAKGSFDQSNAVAFGREVGGARDQATLTAELRVLEGGDGGAFVFLNTADYGSQGPAPYAAAWTAPNFAGSFAVGIDVHNPKDEDPFRGHGNYEGRPQREVSLHFDGRELVKRVADAEFRGDWAALEITMHGVPGGSEVSVTIGESTVYDSFFVAGMVPYESRLVMGASTLGDAATQFDVRDVKLTYGEVAAAPRPAIHFPVFNHVLTNNSKTAYQTEVELPPVNWEFGRVILTLQIHDGGDSWDEWDRNGTVSVWDDEGNKHTIVPFITSYRTECFWQVDVTAFRPWLAGKTKFEVAAGTGFYKNLGFMMSVDLDYYHGKPQLGGETRAPFQVIPLWEGTARYGSDETPFGNVFQPVRLELPSNSVAARIVTFVTGHSQIGEFTPSTRRLHVQPGIDLTRAPDAPAEPLDPPVYHFDDTLWKTDCYLNPNRPQGGTWKYSRAGWAPGDVVAPWVVDPKLYVPMRTTVGLNYVAAPYDFSEMPENARPDAGTIGAANQVVSSYLVLYGDGEDLVSAPVLRVSGVTGGSSAANAGILVGDYLASYAGTAIDSVEQLTAAKTAATEAGLEMAAIVVYRGAERLELEMATGQMGVNLSAR